MGDSIIDFLPDVLPFWGSLKEEEIELIKSHNTIKYVPENSVIYHAGQENSGLKIIKSGQIRMSLSSANGGEITLFRLTSGDLCILSVMGMMEDFDLDINMEAEKDSQVIIIPEPIYRKLYDDNIAVSRFTRDLINVRFAEIIRTMAHILFSNTGKKLADALVNHCDLENSNTILVTHETLAKDIGTAREVVTRTLKQFQASGLVSIARGKITLHNLEELKRQ